MSSSTPSRFYGLGIAPSILSVLDKLGFTIPTPIQEQSIPLAVEGKDVVGIAQTGTGKTLAFGIPLIQQALQRKQGLVVLPTRELALQVQEALRKIGTPMGIKTALLIGGEPLGRQTQALRRTPDIIIGTPGRIIDHMQQKNLSLGQIRILVLDEADRMLDMGFAPQLKQILTNVPTDRQTMLFSATMPNAILAIARSYLRQPTRVEIATPGTAATSVTQELYFVPRHDKPRLLEEVLGRYRGSVLIFTRTKFGAKKIAATVRALKHTAAEIHSNRSLNQRKEALEGFRNGRYRILVATDIAARGIDVRGIELVINYDLPDNSEDYVHRIGRTGRAGGSGHAISFATHDQRWDVRGIERLMRTTLPVSTLPELPPARAEVPTEIERPERPRYGSSTGRTGGGYRGGGASRSSSGSSASGAHRGPARGGSYGHAARPGGGARRPWGNGGGSRSSAPRRPASR